MDLDPNVQVALVSVFATFITTLGIIAVAIINNRKERARAADAGVEAGLDEKDVLTRILALISENDAKDKELSDMKIENLRLVEENNKLSEENRRLKLSATPYDYDEAPDV